MPLSLFLSFLFYAFDMGITPGPANFASLAASLQFGKKAFLRQWTGLFFGFFTDAVIASILLYFVGAVLNEYVKWLSILGALYMIYLAWHILKMNYTDTPAGSKDNNSEDENSEKSAENTEKPAVREPGFLSGFLLQLTNVKVILTIVTSISTYVLPVFQDLPRIMLWGIPVVMIGPVTNLVWGFAGLALKKLFARYTRIVNIVLALSLVLCAVSLVSILF